MPKKMILGFQSISPIIDEKKIAPPSIVQLAVDDKYKFSKLTEIGMSLFVALADPADLKAERNLRQNLFQHMKRAKKKYGMELIIRKTTLDPNDPSSRVGFRVWRVKPETKKKR